MPISQHLDAERNFNPEARRFFENYFVALRANGVEPVAAVLMEDWGKRTLPTVEFTANDVRAIEAADAIVLITKTRLTRDMFLELGIALGFGQFGIILLPEKAWKTEILTGLEQLQRLAIIRFGPHNSLVFAATIVVELAWNRVVEWSTSGVK